MVLYSIIIGIGMSQILMAIGRILQTENKIQLYWIHSAWVLLVFFLHIFVWFNAWEYKAILIWKISKFLSFLAVPIILFIISVITFPDIYQEKEYDFRDYYYACFGWLYGLLAILILIVSINEYILLDQQLFVWKNGVRGAAFLVLWSGFLSQRPWAHALQIIVLYGLIIVSTAAFRSTVA